MLWQQSSSKWSNLYIMHLSTTTIKFFLLLFLLLLLVEENVSGMKQAGKKRKLLTDPADVPMEIGESTNRMMKKHHAEKKTILYCSDNKYHSHFMVSMNLALRLKARYKVHFLVLDHSPDKDETDGIYKQIYASLDADFMLIRVPVDAEYLKKTFLDHIKGGFSDWSSPIDEIRSKNPDFWIYETMNTLNMYQAVAVQNPVVKVTIYNKEGINNQQQQVAEHQRLHVLDWLRQQQHQTAHGYALAMAEWGRLTAAFHIFHELGIKRMVATAAPVVQPAYYHFLGMPIPLDIPEFYSAQPKFNNGGGASLFDNRAEYERVINAFRKMFFEDNLKFMAEFREEAAKKGIHLKETPPLGEMLPKCHALLTNQPGEGVDFHWQKPPMVKHIGGIAINKMELYRAKVSGSPEEYAAEIGKIEPGKLWNPTEKCIVLFIMGTIVNFNGFSDAYFDAMMGAFTEHRQCKFLVRIDREMFAEKIRKLATTGNAEMNKSSSSSSSSSSPSSSSSFHYKNVEIIDFNTRVAQQEILGQKNLKALITHCGQNTFNEAVYASVPLICFPFFYDQPYNAALIEHLYIGIFVKPVEFAIKFPQALREILRNDKYSDEAKLIALRLHGARKKPAEIFADSISEAIQSKMIMGREIHFIGGT